MPKISLEYINILVGTLPGQRYDWYTHDNIEQVKRNVLEELDQEDSDLGFFNLSS